MTTGPDTVPDCAATVGIFDPGNPGYFARDFFSRIDSIEFRGSAIRSRKNSVRLMNIPVEAKIEY